jgi:hypothetical protein
LTGKKPEKKPFGRDGPPKGYPKDPSAYADPENWRYPLHTSWNAKAARRYFDDWSNRAKYSEEEREYIDRRINEALNQFGQKVAVSGIGRPAPKIPKQKNVEELTIEEMLKLFLGAARLKRAEEMEDSLVSFSDVDSRQINGKVKEYIVHIDLANRTILHDCEDWRKNMDSKNMCKHLGKLLLMLDQKKASDLLRDILKNKDQWKFSAP